KPAPNGRIQIGVQELQIAAHEDFGATPPRAIDAPTDIVARRELALIVHQVLQVQDDHVGSERIQPFHQVGALRWDQQPGPPHLLSSHPRAAFNATIASAATAPSPSGSTSSGLMSTSEISSSRWTARCDAATSVPASASTSAGKRPR